MIVNEGETLIKKLSGYSNSEVALLVNGSGPFVRKHGNIKRNIDRISYLEECGFVFPRIRCIAAEEEYYDMEYIPSLDMKTYLLRHPVGPLIEFLQKSLVTLSWVSDVVKDYYPVYEEKTNFLNEIVYSYKLCFTRDRLLEKLPRNIVKSKYYGDLNLDNILYDERACRFVFIDAVTIEYDSYAFDLAKLNQDLISKWFIRKEPELHLDGKLSSIYHALSEVYPIMEDRYLQILMLLRILPYAREKSKSDEEYLFKRINELWTS